MSAPPLPGAELGFSSLLKTGSALFFILAMIFFGFWIIRRYGDKFGVGGLKRAGMEILGQLPLGPKRHLTVVRYRGRLLVLGVTEHSVNLVTEIRETESKEEAGEDDLSFQTHLDKSGGD